MNGTPGSTETELDIEYNLAEVDPKDLEIYKKIQSGDITPEEFSKIINADSLIEGFLHTEGFEKKLARYLEKGVPGALIAFDVDYFKQFNDSQGHPAGDDLLKLIGKIVREQTRTGEPETKIKDQRKNRRPEFDLLCRAGGDEFLIFLVGAELHDTSKAAKRIWTAMVATAQQTFPGYPNKQTMSTGITEAKENDTVRTIRERADEYLYKAKQSRDDPNRTESDSIVIG